MARPEVMSLMSSRSSERYWMDSRIWAPWIFSEPARSAMVRAERCKIECHFRRLPRWPHRRLRRGRPSHRSGGCGEKIFNLLAAILFRINDQPFAGDLRQSNSGFRSQRVRRMHGHTYGSARFFRNLGMHLVNDLIEIHLRILTR